LAEATGRQFVSLGDIPEGEDFMEGFDPTADAYAPPAPVAPSTYLGTITFAVDDPEQRWERKTYNAEKYPEREGQAYYVTRIKGRITDGGQYDNRVVFDDFMSTGIFNSGTSGVASLLKQLGYDLSNVTKQTQLCQLLEQALAGEPQVKFTTDWEWRGSAESGYLRIRGQRKIFERAGKETHIVEDPATGEERPARAVITRYAPA
jgi:hypothetical protein